MFLALQGLAILSLPIEGVWQRFMKHHEQIQPLAPRLLDKRVAAGYLDGRAGGPTGE